MEFFQELSKHYTSRISDLQHYLGNEGAELLIIRNIITNGTDIEWDLFEAKLQEFIEHTPFCWEHITKLLLQAIKENAGLSIISSLLEHLMCQGEEEKIQKDVMTSALKKAMDLAVDKALEDAREGICLKTCTVQHLVAYGGDVTGSTHWGTFSRALAVSLQSPKDFDLSLKVALTPNPPSYPASYARYDLRSRSRAAAERTKNEGKQHRPWWRRIWWRRI